ncbi:ABC transporter substrate-binding protein [Lederbergia galactosidilytica]|uniref:Sugar ABC transporter substrate-binding protein n=1 Tax=Lederbergia galactosidilytica TaxID=217031 RepID=A0A177ZLQ4_9BACI|nr:extracellular solute-binding protein [Lederbergia galactosidilytica]KRG15717.1 sugar ABC transporter substrate-binding protein [Virgibacillus soli]MBP1916808.1 raffinose/stachyose/melibiose transport system substrate-binding protein [Lederbergia galactosidilytica]OAK68513.1 sugar ABC transporter substrate-binding protein [Lederbergia galactosidilytica]
MKKSFVVLLILILTGGLLAACGSSSSSTNSSGEKLEKVDLKVFISQPRFKEQYETYLDQFVEKQKEEKGRDVNIKLEMPSVNQADQLLKTRLASGDSPDVFNLHAINDIPTYDKAGYLEDLSDQPFVDTIYETVIPAVTKDDRVLAVPLETLQWGFLYNKDIFAEYNLEVPTTLTELENVIKTLEENDITPFIRAYKDTYIPQLFLPLVVGSANETSNKGFIDNMNEGKGSFDELKDLMFPVIDLVNDHGTDRPLEIGQDQGAADFANGKAAMWVQGPWMAESIEKSNGDINFGVAPLPISDDPSQTLINLGTSTSLAVYKDSKVKDVALDFINYIMDEQDSSGLYESLAFNPISELHTFPLYPWLEESQSYIEEGKVYQDPSIPSAVKSESEKLLQSYLAGDKSQEDVLKGLDRAWQQFLEVNK